jgi:diguanylate cyclase (GGDEF)-like protein
VVARAHGLRLFAWYALATALPVVLLGAALSHMYQAQIDRHALDQAVAEARAIATAGVEPHLAGHDLGATLQPQERAAVAGAVGRLLTSGSVLRLRLRDRDGSVVFDAAHPHARPIRGEDDEAKEAAAGNPVRKLTRVGEDAIDRAGREGAAAVEVYLALYSDGAHRNVVGVLEVYLPYEPIAESVASARHRMAVVIVVGLALLWVLLSAITWSVTRRLRRTAAANEHLALHDPLTGLPNRNQFSRLLRATVETAALTGGDVVAAILDLERFKEVNDVLGHENGDEFLRVVADRLQATLRPGDTLARLGGDEFGIVLAGVDATTARAVLQRVQETVAADVEIGVLPVSIETCIGVATYPRHAADADELLRSAELAMYAAKQAREGLVEYSEGLEHFDPGRLALVGQLRRAIANDELVLHYQPKIDLRTGSVAGLEALVRWQHPTRGLLPPAEFVDVAESTGLIDPLTDWVVEHALRQVAEWRGRTASVPVAVNISARNLRDERLPDRIADRLRAHGVEPRYLEVEVTETAVIANPETALSVLARLHAQGVRVAVDDFGRGYTSLAQLARMPLSELKIDRAFVGAMHTTERDEAIVRTLIELGHQLGLDVVAEGAETDAAVAALRALGCDTVQGYVYSRPLPPDEAIAWIDARAARPISTPV